MKVERVEGTGIVLTHLVQVPDVVVGVRKHFLQELRVVVVHALLSELLDLYRIGSILEVLAFEVDWFVLSLVGHHSVLFGTLRS